MNDINKLFECAMGAAVKYSGGKEKGRGIAFGKGDGKNYAVIAASHYAVHIIGIPDPKAVFFSYLNNCYTDEYEYPVSIDDILKVLYATTSESIGCLTVKNSNFNQYLSNIDSLLGKNGKGRFVIRQPTPVDKELIIHFTDAFGSKVYNSSRVPKTFVVDDNSIIKPADIGSGFYKCLIVGEDDDSYYMNAVEVYGSLVVDILHTQYMYDALNPPPVNPTHSFGFPIFSGDISTFKSIHIDATSTFTLLSLFRILPDSADISIEFFADPLHPLHIAATDGETEIFATLAVLDSSDSKQYNWR